MRYYFHLAYWTIVITSCVMYFLNSDLFFSTWSLLSGFFAPLITWACGSGIKGSLYGSTGQKITGIILGVIGLIVCMIWIYNTGWLVIFSGYQINGITWLLIGFLIGFIFTAKKDAVID
jgi:hypothetical protein